jgi:hypothetical protein
MPETPTNKIQIKKTNKIPEPDPRIGETIAIKSKPNPNKRIAKSPLRAK